MPLDQTLYCLGQVLAWTGTGLFISSALFLVSALTARNRLMDAALAGFVISAAVTIIVSLVYVSIFVGKLTQIAAG